MWNMPAVDRLAATQCGLVTFRQLVDLGVTPRQVQRAVDAGRLIRVGCGVMRTAGASASAHQRLWRATLLVGDPCAISHLSALSLHGLWPEPRPVDVVVPRGRMPEHAGITVHRTVIWDATDLHDIDGLKVTSLARTLIDISGRVSTGRLQRLVDEAQRAKKLTLDQLVEARGAITHGRGRRLSRVDAVLHTSSGRRPGRSAPEVDVYELVVAAGYPPPEQNLIVQVGVDTFELDLAWPDRKIAIEYDGEAPHSLAVDRTRDRRKDRRLTAHGWDVLRTDGQTDTDELLDDLDGAWRHREPAPKSA